jgi:hypothetical protein
MIAERTLAQAAHAWGAQGIPFNDEPKTELSRTASMERATRLLNLLNQSAALRSLMLLSGEKRWWTSSRFSVTGIPSRTRSRREISSMNNIRLAHFHHSVGIFEPA